MIKRLVFTLLALSIIPVWIGCGGLPKSAVAQVNGKVITREDLDRRIEDLKLQYQGQGLPEPGSPQYPEFQKQVAQELVTEEVVWFEADKKGIVVSDEEINDQIEQLKQMTGGEDKFQEALSQRSLTLDRLKENIRKGLIYQRIISEVTKDTPQVTEEDVRDYYNQHKSDPSFQKPETRKVSHILVKDEATANQVKAQLDAGADFASLAKQYSTDESTKNKGGDLGEVPSSGSGFVAEFEQAMNQLAAGQTSGPVKTQFGYHIIRVDSISPPGTRSFDDVKEELEANLQSQRQQESFNKWLEEAKSNYTITYADEFKPTETTPATETPATTTETSPQPGS
jgi:foldase protein PrsA